MQQFFTFPIRSACGFDSFVPCDGNAAALEFARRIADPANPENLLYLYGPSGSGKTHLLRAIARALGNDEALSLFSCRECRSVEDLTILGGRPALLVDDLHALPDDPLVRAGLWQLFNDFYCSGRKIALAGLHPPRELPCLDDHLISRLLWGLVACVDTTDDTSRRMILKKIADDRQVRVPDDVMYHILATASREVGELISAFDAVYCRSMAEKRKISLALARQTLGHGTAGGAP
jgi:chromosomal replication initiator protein